MDDKKNTTIAVSAKSAVAATPVDDTPKTTRVPADQPAEKVAEPKVSEVKSSNNTVGTKEAQELDKNIKARVEATAASVSALNESNTAANEAKPFVKPVVETVKAKTPDEAIADRVKATAESVRAFNASVEGTNKPSPTADERMKPEVSRVAPLTGELRSDPENDSYVTPGKVPSPPDPKPGETPLEIEQAPMVISPLTGEVKRADEISYPAPGMGRDMSLVSEALNDKVFMVDSTKTKFGVAPGQQVSLLNANEEAWANDDAMREDMSSRAAMLAEAMVSTDSLRRQRRYQKNLR